MSSRPCVWWRKLSTIPPCTRPPRNSATRAMMSSKQSGFGHRNHLFHAPRFELEYRGGFGIFRVTERARIVSKDRFSPHGWFFRLFKRGFTKTKDQSLMWRVRRPQKSQLTRPAVSTSFLSNCVSGSYLPHHSKSLQSLRWRWVKSPHPPRAFRRYRYSLQNATLVDQIFDFFVPIS